MLRALLAVFIPAACAAQAHEPIAPRERAEWVMMRTAGPQNLMGGVAVAAWGTWHNQPVEYGPGWEGFGKRYGMRLSGNATSNVMEAGLGAVWGEDPRYLRAGGGGFKRRLGYVLKSTFAARQDGVWKPAYARYAAISGSNFLSNTWRADSEATAGDATLRTGLGFAGRFVSNAFEEFWPDIKRHVFHGD